MQRRAQRDDQQDHRAERARRAGGVNRALAAAAALPVLLLTAACSSDSDSGSDSGSGSGSGDTKSGASATASASAAPTVQAAVFKSLPQACSTIAKKTLTELVPKAKSGKSGASSSPADRASCSWSSLDNNGVKGSQFRWLNVSLLRFESDALRGSGESQAQEYYEKQVKDTQAVSGAKNTKSAAVSGTGDAATSVRYDLKKKEGAFKQQTVVSRVENVVITLDYNGAGLAGEKTPSADTLAKLAEKAAKEAVASVESANGAGSTPSSPTATSSASKSATSSKSASASAKATPSTSASGKS